MPEIFIDDEVFAALQKRAQPLVDDANSVLRRVFGLMELPSTLADQKKSGLTIYPTHRATDDDEALLPKEFYSRAILLALAEMNGEAKRSRILRHIGQLLNDEHTSVDLAPYKGGGIRWRHRASWQKNELINNGFLEPNTIYGIWKLTEKGWKRAREIKDEEGMEIK